MTALLADQISRATHIYISPLFRYVETDMHSSLTVTVLHCHETPAFKRYEVKPSSTRTNPPPLGHNHFLLPWDRTRLELF